VAKYALQKIKYRPTTSFRSGPGVGYEYGDEDAVVAWWSMSSRIISATFPTPDMAEEKYGNLELKFDNTAERGVIEATVPSQKIANNSSLFHFSGDVGKVVDLTNSLSFTNGSSDTPFTISFWIKPITTTFDRTVLAKWNSADNLEEYIVQVLANNRIKVKLSSGGDGTSNSIEYVSTGTVADNAWSHVAIIYDGIPVTGNTASIKVFINGIDTGRNSGSTAAGYVAMLPTATSLGIGRDSAEATNGIHANLSDIIFYNKKLTQNTVLALYHAKDGVWVRARNYDKKGSRAQMTEGGSTDPFREGVSIRNGEDLSTSIRMKIHSGLNFVKAHSGSAISVDAPFDDSDIPESYGTVATNASTSITVAGGPLLINTFITITSTDQTRKRYISITEDHGSIANGTILAAGHNPDGVRVMSANDYRVGMIAFMLGGNAADAATMLAAAINHANGHNQGVADKKIRITNNSAGKLTLEQVMKGAAGNTPVQTFGRTGYNQRITVENNAFTRGLDGSATKFLGVLDSSRGKSGYSALLLHEVEKRDFGTLNRHQDGTAFNDSVFDSPQKILEDVRTTAGSSQDRHLRVYIGETPNELYNPTDVYDKEARVDIFDRNIKFRETIPDLRDAEKDFTRRSRRLTRSGSWTISKRNRGFTGECNCIQLNDFRYNDIREASVPFYEFYNEGDISLPSSIAERKFMHLGRGKIETVLSQSSGPRLTETSPKGKEPYGVYAQSTVNTFYGIAGSDKLQGRTFTARYRVSSADRPFHDTSKEDLVPTLINTSNDTDFITEVKTLYMTGASVHEGGLTGYSMATAGFQGDLGAHNRDSMVFAGLKRGQ
jgi:hypothetical protein